MSKYIEPTTFTKMTLRCDNISLRWKNIYICPNDVYEVFCIEESNDKFPNGECLKDDSQNY